MTKGTQAQGKRGNKSHTLSRFSGKQNWHKQKHRDAGTGSPGGKIRRYNWATKTKRRTGQGTGRMQYLKTATWSGSMAPPGAPVCRTAGGGGGVTTRLQGAGARDVCIGHARSLPQGRARSMPQCLAKYATQLEWEQKWQAGARGAVIRL